MKINLKITRDDIKCEWNSFASIRHEQIISGIDDSFSHVLLPTLIALLDDAKYENILDFGCGTGILTARLSQLSKNIVGVDPSDVSIKIAKSYCKDIKNIVFQECFIEDFTPKLRFNAITANMVLMDAVNIPLIFEKVKSLLTKDGVFVFTITHPCYWPIYWGYFDEPWFNYNECIPISKNFKITNEMSQYSTTHIHRPISYYQNMLATKGLKVININEPLPAEDASLSENYNRRYPRFLALKCTHQ